MGGGKGEGTVPLTEILRSSPGALPIVLKILISVASEGQIRIDLQNFIEISQKGERIL